MICMAILCTALLVVIEADIFQSCSKFSVFSVPEPRDDMDLDDDVLAEEERLAKQTISKKRAGSEDDTSAPLLDQEA